MRSVALYGFATVSREGIHQTQADEIWSMTWAYNYDVPRIDRLLEIHPIWMQAQSKKPEYEKPRKHWEWLKQNTTIPVYMMLKHPEVPMSVKYPLADVFRLVPEERRHKVFTSSFDFLMALAILEGFERIEPYGFEMGSDTEYRYQREGAAYWISQCDARGIELVLPENTALLRNKIYMYEGGSMIYRQDLERLKVTYEKMKKNAYARLSNYEGQLGAKAQQDEDWQELAQKRDSQYRLCLITEGYVNCVDYLLKEIDLEEPEIQLVDPMELIPLEVT